MALARFLHSLDECPSLFTLAPSFFNVLGVLIQILSVVSICILCGMVPPDQVNPLSALWGVLGVLVVLKNSIRGTLTLLIGILIDNINKINI